MHHSAYHSVIHYHTTIIHSINIATFCEQVLKRLACARKRAQICCQYCYCLPGKRRFGAIIKLFLDFAFIEQ